MEFGERKKIFGVSSRGLWARHSVVCVWSAARILHRNSSESVES